MINFREVEEDQQLNEMMQNLGKHWVKWFSFRWEFPFWMNNSKTHYFSLWIGVKKAKNKRKSSISKLFRRKGKRRVEWSPRELKGSPVSLCYYYHLFFNSLRLLHSCAAAHSVVKRRQTKRCQIRHIKDKFMWCV